MGLGHVSEAGYLTRMNGPGGVVLGPRPRPRPLQPARPAICPSTAPRLYGSTAQRLNGSTGSIVWRRRRPTCPVCSGRGIQIKPSAVHGRGSTTQRKQRPREDTEGRIGPQPGPMHFRAGPTCPGTPACFCVHSIHSFPRQTNSSVHPSNGARQLMEGATTTEITRGTGVRLAIQPSRVGHFPLFPCSDPKQLS